MYGIFMAICLASVSADGKLTGELEQCGEITFEAPKLIETQAECEAAAADILKNPEPLAYEDGKPVIIVKAQCVKLEGA